LFVSLAYGLGESERRKNEAEIELGGSTRKRRGDAIGTVAGIYFHGKKKTSAHKGKVLS